MNAKMRYDFLACVFRGTPARFEKEAIKAKVEPPVGVEPTSAELEVRDVFLYHYSGAQLFTRNLLFWRAYIREMIISIRGQTRNSAIRGTYHSPKQQRSLFVP